MLLPWRSYLMFVMLPCVEHMVSSSPNHQDSCNLSKAVIIINKANMTTETTCFPLMVNQDGKLELNAILHLTAKCLSMVDLDHQYTWKMVHLTFSFSCIWKSWLSSQSYSSQLHWWVMGIFTMAIPHPLPTIIFSFYLVCMWADHGQWLSPSRELVLWSWLESTIDPRHENLTDILRDTVLYFKSILLLWDNSWIWFFLKSIEGNCMPLNKNEFWSVCTCIHMAVQSTFSVGLLLLLLLFRAYLIDILFVSSIAEI